MPKKFYAERPEDDLLYAARYCSARPIFGYRYWLWLSAVALGTFLGLWFSYRG